MIKELLARRALRPDIPWKALVVVPFQALALEKARDLRRRVQSLVSRGGFGFSLDKSRDASPSDGHPLDSSSAAATAPTSSVWLSSVGAACGLAQSTKANQAAVRGVHKCVSLTLRIGECFGRHSLRSVESCDVIVCTIEKACRWVTQLSMQGRLSEIAAIVVDELDIVGRDSRGALIERMLGLVRLAGSEVVWPWPEPRNRASTSSTHDGTTGTLGIKH